MAGLPSEKSLQILAVLIAHGGEMTGKDVQDADDDLKKDTVHGTLRRLASDGFVTGRKEEGGIVPGHPRLFYTITATGVAAVKAAEVAAIIMSGGVLHGKSGGRKP